MYTYNVSLSYSVSLSQAEEDVAEEEMFGAELLPHHRPWNCEWAGSLWPLLSPHVETRAHALTFQPQNCCLLWQPTEMQHWKPVLLGHALH